MSVRTERIIYGFHRCQFGEMSIARTDRGICWLGFVQNGKTHKDIEKFLQQKFEGASLLRNDMVADDLGRRAVRAWEEGRENEVKVDLRGTDFQVDVWNALRDIGRGYVCAYSEIAQMIGRPKAVRAVGSAVGDNPVSIIVPCHRVIKKTGDMGNYGWGAELKRKLLLGENIPKEMLDLGQ